MIKLKRTVTYTNLGYYYSSPFNIFLRLSWWSTNVSGAASYWFCKLDPLKELKAYLILRCQSESKSKKEITQQ